MKPLLLIAVLIVLCISDKTLCQDSALLAREYHSISGMGNNSYHRAWGAAGMYLPRIAQAQYSDGKSTPSGHTRPNPRHISNILLNQGTSSFPIDYGQSSFLWAWAQFIEHDIFFAQTSEPQERFNIAVPVNDSQLDPYGEGQSEICFNRSDYFNHFSNIRQQINSVSSFIDGSMVYGSDSLRANALRVYDGTGRLRTGKDDLLPFNGFGFDNWGGNGTELFLAGDSRANQNVVLTSLHTLFLREHNFWCNVIMSIKPDLSDYQIYNQAREMVIAEIQAITFNEFLPALLGPDPLAPYSGYNPKLNPTVSNEFATAIVQMYQSMINRKILRLNSDLDTISQGNLTFRDGMYNVNAIINDGNIDPIIRGLVYQKAERVDIFIIDDLRNDKKTDINGFDLAAVNIQRGRDHGFTDYNQFRTAIGLVPVRSVSNISSDPVVCSRIQRAYSYINDMDIWPIVLAEDHVIGSSVGITLYKVLKKQFQLLRDADRFWYQNNLTPYLVKLIERRNLAQIIITNTGIGGKEIPGNVFYAVTD